MKILSVDSKNSSINLYLYEMNDESLLASFVFDRIGLENSNYTISYNNELIKEEVELESHHEAVKMFLDKIVDLGVVNSLDDIKGIGHKIIHGEILFSSSVRLTDKVVEIIESMDEFIRILNYGSLMGIKAFKELLPECLMVGCFDTAFHQTIEMDNYLYSLPFKWYREYGVRKYGFQGINHQYVCECIKKEINKADFKMISCHLNEDGSVCAINNMKVVDTSMGFTSVSGIMMATKSGDIDPSIIPFVMEKEGKNVGEILDDLNNASGLLGLSEYSSDIKDIYNNQNSLEEKVIVSKDKYVRRIVDYIAQYYVLLNGVDVIAFSGNILENNVSIRREICEKLSCLGVKIDLDINTKVGEMIKISTEESNISVFVVPACEELMIAKEVVNLLNR